MASATELPILDDDFNLDADARKALHAYVVGLQDWVADILDWHRLTGRYDENGIAAALSDAHAAS